MSKKFEGSVAPRERINISYVPKTDGQTAEVELPLNMLVVGDISNSPSCTATCWQSRTRLYQGNRR